MQESQHLPPSTRFWRNAPSVSCQVWEKKCIKPKQCLKEHKSNRLCNKVEPSRLRSCCWVSVYVQCRVYMEVAGESSLKGFGCFSSDWPGFIVLSAFTHFYCWQYLWILCCVAFTGCLSFDMVTASNGLVSKRLTPECLIVYALKQLADSWKILDSQHGKSRQENLIKLSGYLETPHTHIPQHKHLHAYADRYMTCILADVKIWLESPSQKVLYYTVKKDTGSQSRDMEFKLVQ